MSPAAPERLRCAVQLLGVSPDDEVLEIGCGPGVAVALIADQLVGGHITAVDRSATAIERATRRNAGHVASGKAVFRHVDLARLVLDDQKLDDQKLDDQKLDDQKLDDQKLDHQRFDKVFAVNVNVFWVGPADAEVRRLKDLLRPDGVVCLVYETPDPANTDRVVGTVTEALTSQGFSTETTISTSPAVICITARLDQEDVS